MRWFSAHRQLIWPVFAIAFSLIVVIPVPMSAVSARSTVSTSECGNVTTNTEWTTAGSPYLLTCTVLVYPNVTLTVDPGVTIQAAGNGQAIGNTQLWIKGTLVASGTAASPIICNEPLKLDQGPTKGYPGPRREGVSDATTAEV